MTLFNIVYTPKCDSNLILLSQLHKSEISSSNYLDTMIFKQKRSKIWLVVRYKNFFVLEIEFGNKAILVQKENCPKYLFSSNPQIRLWHHCFNHIKNAKIV